MLLKHLQILLIPILLLSHFSAPLEKSLPAQPAGWELLGQAGGPSQGLAAQGNYVYMGVGSSLVVLDISDPTDPNPVGASMPLDYFIQGVTVSGPFAYVAAGSAGLYIMDLAIPANPTVVSRWDSPGFAENVTVSGSIAYLADGPDGLRVLDVSDPVNPAEIANAFAMNYIVDVAIGGRYAYLAADGAGLLVAEISNPQYPVEAGRYDTVGYGRSVATAGSKVVLADEYKGLVILDVSNPIHPTLSGSAQLDGWALDVFVSGNMVYVAAAFGGLQIVNISNPANPVVEGSITWDRSNAVSVAVANGQILIADRKNGLRLMDGSNPTAPLQRGDWNTFSFAYSVAFADEYAYVASGFNGVRIYNLEHAAHPVEVGLLRTEGFFYTLKVSGNRLFAGTMTGGPQNGLYAWDISDPVHPTQIGYYQDAMECRAIEVAGNMIYVADGNGLKIYELNNPPALNLIGFYPLNQTRGLTVRNGLVFVTQQFEGLQILDVSNPADIHLVGSFNADDSFTFGPVGISGQYAYITEAWGLRVLDISEPATPVEVSVTPFLFNENPWLVLDDDRNLIYVAQGPYGFSVFDISNPAAPLLINHQASVLGSVQMLDWAGGRMAAASGESGLQIFTETTFAVPPPSHVPTLPAFNPGIVPVVPSDSRQEINLLPSINQPVAPERPAVTCTVTSTANAGPGTLRNCLENQVSGDLIIFSPGVFPPTAPATIFIGPESLPNITQHHITIDASNAGVILDGSAVPGTWDPGINIYFSNNNVVRGLQVRNFPVGISISGNHNVIGGSRLVGSGPTGQGNVVSGNNGQAGISIQDGAEGNMVLGNIVGLDSTGTQAYPNQGIGISVNKVANNTIGSLNPGEDNIVSANQDAGILLYGFSNIGNKVIGNKVGTDITGNLNLGNQGVGVYIESGSSNTLLQGNLISGNKIAEVYVWDFETDFNILIGNFIGTNLAGDTPLPDLTSTGIGVGFAGYTRIGGTSLGEGNVIANPEGVFVVAPFSAQTRIVGNHVGVNAAGTAVLEGGGGILLKDVTRTIVGGATLEEANYLTADDAYNIKVMSMNNVIAGNFMGLAVDGVTPFSTADFHVYSTFDGNIIQGNRIANSISAGIYLDGAQKNTIRRNLVWANPFKGIALGNGANANLSAPTLSLNASGGSGTTCPGCEVELFLDDGNQGRFYLDHLIADSSGNFAFLPYCPLSFMNVAATTTDWIGNTSEFSTSHPAPWDCMAPRPIPMLITLSPSSQPTFAPTFALTLGGHDFYANSVVRWNGADLPTVIISSTEARAIVPSYLFWLGGEFSVTMYTPAPGGGESNALLVSVAPPQKIYFPMMLR